MSDAAGLVSGDVRRHNLALVLEHVARGGQSSRSEIATDTGLTRGAVTGLVQVLIDGGWLRETDSVALAKGRPRTQLELAADGYALLAIEIAPDAVRALATSVGGETLLTAREDHRGADSDTVMRMVGRLLDEMVRTLKTTDRLVVDATAIVLAPVGGAPARLLADATLGWRDVDVVGTLEQLVPDLPPTTLRLSSDSPLAAAAELRRLDGIRNAIYLKGDSNVGGALVIDGKAVEGAHGFGGSLGHLAVVPDGDLCTCGQHGCLITVAGVPALLRAAGMNAELDSLDASAALEAFVSRVVAQQPAAVGAWTAAVPWIGRTLRILAMAVDPEIVVIGGLWSALTDSIKAAFEDDRPEISRPSDFSVRVLSGALGNDAGLTGAIEAARERVLRSPLMSRP